MARGVDARQFGAMTMHAPLRLLLAAPVRWPGGEAQLCRADALPELPRDRFVAAFACRDARGRWEAATGDRRLIAAGPGPLPPLALPPATELLLIALEPSFLLDAAGRAWHPNLTFRTIADGGDDIAWLIGAALRRECADEGAHGPDYAARLAAVLAVRLAERHVRLDTVAPLQGGLTGHRLRTCLDHIERNLHREVTLAELAELAGLSTTHFARAFRRSLGEPPYRHFRRRRIERAKALLAGTEQGIAQIALECGYAAQSHFTSAFKMLTMTTPAAYRRAVRDMQRG
jgi:AraC-like DNA-binding protein